MADMSAEFRSGDLYALIYAQDQTNDARTIAGLIRQDFRSSKLGWAFASQGTNEVIAR